MMRLKVVVEFRVNHWVSEYETIDREAAKEAVEGAVMVAMEEIASKGGFGHEHSKELEVKFSGVEVIPSSFVEVIPERTEHE